MDYSRSSGSGPGAQTIDGCSVELYRRLPYGGELDGLREHLAPGSTLLELGCGTGRLTRVLLGFGLVVTAVDESAEMLAHVPSEARLVRSRIEALQLDEGFDVVLLASGLVNHADAQVRSAFLQAARRHLKPEGRLILQRQGDWLRTVEPGQLGPHTWADAVVRDTEGVHIRLRYALDDLEWTHSFSAVALDDEDLAGLLSAEGFGDVGFLDARELWACVRRAAAGELSPR